MSGAMENRAAVFTSRPQDVEVYRNGAWWPGSLLGWRHDAAGGCRVWVRPAADCAEEYWTALEYLRLPEVAPVAAEERHLSLVEPAAGRAVDDSALTATMAAVRAVPSPAVRGAGAPAPSETTSAISLVAMRDLDDGARTLSPAAGGPAPRPGGPRRADEPAPGSAERAPAVHATAGGRHRAPASGGNVSGRHRAADSGVLAAVHPGGPAGCAPAPTPRDEVRDADLFTRPMRLDDIPGRVPQPRRAALEGRLAGR